MLLLSQLVVNSDHELDIVVLCLSKSACSFNVSLCVSLCGINIFPILRDQLADLLYESRIAELCNDGVLLGDVIVKISLEVRNERVDRVNTGSSIDLGRAIRSDRFSA